MCNPARLFTLYSSGIVHHFEKADTAVAMFAVASGALKRKLASLAVALPLTAAVLVSGIGTASANTVSIHNTLVAPDSINVPDVLNGGVHAVTEISGKVFVGGSFTSVADSDGSILELPYLFAFDKETGFIDRGFMPQLNRSVLALGPGEDGASIFVGGYFTTVGGQINKKGLTKLDFTGERVRGFAGRTDGIVKDMVVRGSKVYIVGRFSKIGPSPANSFAAIDATTGLLLPDIALEFADPISRNGVLGALSVDDIDLTPDGVQAIVAGNFSSIEGQPRWRLAVVDLSGQTATVSPWNTNLFSTECQLNRFPQPILGLDVSPDGSYFIVGSTGGLGHAGCDSVVRFDLSPIGPDVQPTWVADTGTDSVYEVAATGHAVFAGGHFRWFNNRLDGIHQRFLQPLPGAVDRRGLVALDPLNGLPLKWRSDRSPRGRGTYELLPTDDGLWIGDDTEFLNGASHPRLKFLPIDVNTSILRPEEPLLPVTFLRSASNSGALEAVSFDGTAFGASEKFAWTGWDDTTGGVWLAGSLYYGTNTGNVFQHPVLAAGFGERREVNLNRMTSQHFDVANLGGLYFDYRQGRVYYTKVGVDKLFYRAFTPDTPIFGQDEFVASSDNSAVPWADVRGMDVIGGHLYYGRSSGNLSRVDIADNVVAGSPVTISGPALDGHDWSGRMLATYTGEPLIISAEPDSVIDFPIAESIVRETIVRGRAYAPGGLAGVKVALRDRDSAGWLRRDGSIGAFQWFEASVDTPGAEEAHWSLQVNLVPGSRWRVVTRADALNGMRESGRPSVLFNVLQHAATAYNLDFGTSISRVRGGWTRVTADTDNSLITWGGAPITSVDRGSNVGANDINQDFVVGAGTSTLNLRIGEGVWRVTMNFGDALVARDGVVVRAEGEFIDEVSAAAGQFVYVTRGAPLNQFDVELQDGELNFEISDVLGNAGWSLTRLSLKRMADLPIPIAPN